MLARSRWIALAAVGIIALEGKAYDVSPPAILQDFESSYTSISNKMPDIFESGYGNVYLPPPGITLNGESVGYDVYDRFNLGSPGETTLYGTQNQFENVVNGIHAWGGSATVDLLWTWTNGINNSNNSSFSEFPGLATVLQTTNPSGAGYNTLGYNTTTGDFYPTSDSNQDEEALAGLQHNDPASNYLLIRQPTTAGNPQNIPEGTGVWLGSTVANIPTASNAQYYPDQADVRYENDPALGLTNVPVYSFNTSQPMAGTAVAENLTGYLMRYTQWLVQVMGVDGFRYDGGNNTYPWVMNYLDLATYDASNRTLLNGSKENIFTFSEVYTSNVQTIQQYISKTALTNAAGTVGGDRDALDFPLYFAMTYNLSGSGAFGSGQNNWYNVVQSSLDYGDDGLLNGSSGVKFVSDQDVPAPALSNVAYAYTLMLPGNATVYYNGQNFNNESSNSSGGEFPQGGSTDSFDAAETALGGPFASETGTYNLNPLGGGATTPNGSIASLVDLRNRFGRGNYREDWIEQNILAYERVGSCIVLLSNATSATTSNGDYDSRTFNTDFAPGTILEEYTGNAASTFADPQQNIPEFITVYANSSSSTGASVNVRVPRNVQYNTSTSTTYATGDGYLVYGLPTPTGTLSLTNVASTMGGQTFSTSASNAGYLNGTELFSTVSVIKTASFQLQLSTNAAYLNVTPGQPLVYDQNADGDKAQFTIDGGAITVNPDGTISTTPGSNGEGTTPGDVSYGYQNFATSSPGYYNANGNGSYSQTINTSQLGQGYHYIEVISFRHNSDPTAPPVYSDWYETVYVDTAPANSTVLSFNAASATDTTDRTLSLESVDGLANNMHVFLDLPFSDTDAQVLAQIGSGNQPASEDVNLWQESYSSVKSGNHSVTLVSYKPDGSYSIQRFSSSQLPLLSVNTGNWAGPGDMNSDGTYSSSDILQFQTALQAGNTTFTAAADVNGDGYVNLADAFLLGPILVAHNIGSSILLYNSMCSSSYVTSGTYTVSGSNTILQDTAGTTNVSAGGSLFASYIRGKTLSLAAGTSVKISANGTSASTSKLTSLSMINSAGNWQGQLDLTNNDLIIDYAGSSDPISTIVSMLAEGYAGSAWNGMGIISSSAAASGGITTLGYADTASFPLASLGGQTLDTTSVVIKYTYVGDANLDGKVDASDLAMMVPGGTTWTQGDFNYDGVVNSDDFALFALGAAEQQAQLTQAPEPVAFGLIIPLLVTACGGRRTIARRVRRRGAAHNHINLSQGSEQWL
jgi:alpha-amylase